MATINFTIPDNKIAKIIAAMKGLYSIPTTTDDEGNTTNNFTDSAWAKECVRRWIRDTTARYEQKIAKEAIAFSPDDEMIA